MKYSTLEQQSNLVHLEKQEFAREVIRLKSDNDALRSENAECERQNSEQSDLERVASDMVEDLSVDLYSSQQSIDSLQSKLMRQEVALKALRTDNGNLGAQNVKMKQRLEGLNAENLRLRASMKRQSESFEQEIRVLKTETQRLSWAFTDEFKSKEHETLTTNANSSECTLAKHETTNVSET